MDTQQRKFPEFNQKFQILNSLGEGNTSKVYLGQTKEKPRSYAAIKLLREEFLNRDEDSIKSVENEVIVLKNLQHKNIVNILDFGDQGFVLKPSGREIKNLVYLLLEYVQGGLLFDICQLVGGMKEDGGRFFMHQMLDVLTYMHGKGVVHRDLKLENILVDDNLNLKVADFGFAAIQNINKLKSYRGTMTYMAPEIKEGKQYDGTQIDIFSTGVILFILVQGIFPFKEARTTEYFYDLLCRGDYETYWKKVNGQNLSNEFKDLILRMFSYDPSKRPTLEQIKNHPWMNNSSFDFESTRQNLLEKVKELKSEQKGQANNDDKPMRGITGQALELVREETYQNDHRFNQIILDEFDVEDTPQGLLDQLEEFGINHEKKLSFKIIEGENSSIGEKTIDQEIDEIDGKGIMISQEETGLEIFVSFYKNPLINKEDWDANEPQMRVQFNKKKGSQFDYRELMKDMTAMMNEVLIQPGDYDQNEDEEN